MMISHNFIVKGKNPSLAQQYKLLHRMLKSHVPFIVLNNYDVFGPYPATFFNNHVYVETFEFNRWLLKTIVAPLAEINHLTLGVLLRIASSKLNKLDLTKDEKILLHTNMVNNIWGEFYRIINEELPF